MRERTNCKRKLTCQGDKLDSDCSCLFTLEYPVKRMKYYGLVSVRNEIKIHMPNVRLVACHLVKLASYGGLVRLLMYQMAKGCHKLLESEKNKNKKESRSQAHRNK